MHRGDRSHAPTAAAWTPLLVTVTLLAFAPAAGGAGWSQQAGGATHSGLVALGDAPLDVLAHGNIAPDGRLLAGAGCCLAVDAGASGLLALAIDAPTGSVTGTSSGRDCGLVRFDETLAVQPVGEDFACPYGANLVLYDAGLDAVLVALRGRAPADVGDLPGLPPMPTQDTTVEVQMRSAQSGAILWSWVPPVGASTPAAPGLNPFACPAAALDERAGTLIVACANDNGENVVAKLDPATGTAHWTTTATKPVSAPGVPSAGLPAATPAQGRLAIDGLTLVGGNVVAKGRIPTGSGVGWLAAMAWLDTQTGVQVGYAEDEVAGAAGADSGVGFNGGSQFAASNGKQAAAVVGKTLLLVTPDNPNPTVEPNFVVPASLPDAAGPAWGRETLVVPTGSTAFVRSSVQFGPLSSWPGDEGGRIGQIAIDRDRSAYATVQVPNGNTTENRLARFALPQPDPLSSIPIPRNKPSVVVSATLTTGATELRAGLPQMVWQGAESLVVLDDFGNVALLGPRTEPGFTVEPDTQYPDLGEDVALRITQVPPTNGARPRNVTQVIVGWGDGDVNRWSANETPAAIYNEATDVTLRTTLVFDDETTATVETPMHPGQPQPNPTLLERLLRPENQNYTFFGVGILITLFGTVMAAIGVSKGRRRLAKYLHRLDAIRDEGRRAPFDATHDLHDFREACRLDLANGHLDNAQFTVIEARANEILQTLRQRVLGAFLGRTSDAFNHAVDLALADGAVDPSESQALEGMVARERGLSADERTALAGLVRSWTARATPAKPAPPGARRADVSGDGGIHRPRRPKP